MKQLRTFATIMILGCAATAFAHGDKVGPIEIDHPWSRATAPVVSTGVVYFVLRNPGARPDRLIAVSTPVADKAELHTHVQDGDMLRMRKIDAIDLAPASTTALTSGGLHVMLMGLKQPLVKDQTFPLTLVFEHAGPVTVQVDVQGITDTVPVHTGGGHAGHAHHGKHSHDKHHH